MELRTALGRGPSAMLERAQGPDLGREVMADGWELRAQPAHTGAHKAAIAPLQ